MLAATSIALMICAITASARAQVALRAPDYHPPAPSCLSKLRYFGEGSVTVQYPLQREFGQFRYRVPPHALPVIVGQTGSMRDEAFFETQRWQTARLLARGVCRALNHHEAIERMTITGKHGQRIGLIVTRLVRPGSQTGSGAP